MRKWIVIALAIFIAALAGGRPAQSRVVRLGDSVDPAGDIRGVARLVKEVIAAVQP